MSKQTPNVRQARAVAAGTELARRVAFLESELAAVIGLLRGLADVSVVGDDGELVAENADAVRVGEVERERSRRRVGELEIRLDAIEIRTAPALCTEETELVDRIGALEEAVRWLETATRGIASFCKTTSDGIREVLPREQS